MFASIKQHGDQIKERHKNSTIRLRLCCCFSSREEGSSPAPHRKCCQRDTQPYNMVAKMKRPCDIRNFNTTHRTPSHRNGNVQSKSLSNPLTGTTVRMGGGHRRGGSVYSREFTEEPG